MSATQGRSERRSTLTTEGKRLLEERAHRLRDELIPRIAARLNETERDAQVEAEFGRATEELADIEYLLRHAAIAEESQSDPQVIEIGDEVTIRFDDGTTDHYLIVHPVEATLDEVRISSESPLARAVLGRRVGEEVEVDAPAGSYRCQIVAAKLLDGNGARVARRAEPS